MARKYYLMQARYSFFVSFHLLCAALVATAQNMPLQVRVGVILDLTSPVGHRRAADRHSDGSGGLLRRAPHFSYQSGAPF
jgi:hypothetical protein